MTERDSMSARCRTMTVLVVALGVLGLVAVPVGATPNPATYEVTIRDDTFGQPFSPPVVATHRPGLKLFQPGHTASPEVEAIAEDGNATPLANAVDGDPRVTDATVLDPIAPTGTRTQVPTSRTVTVEARHGDRLSVVGMLICTNDGLVGVDRLRLPRSGSIEVALGDYDAGTEDNTEASPDLVDACTVLGPVDLVGDPNGNNNATVDTDPRGVVTAHPNIAGVGDLVAGSDGHGWTGAVGLLTVTRVD